LKFFQLLNAVSVTKKTLGEGLWKRLSDLTSKQRGCYGLLQVDKAKDIV